MSVVKSLLQLSQSKIAKTVLLSNSEDLKCVNMFCEKVGGPCICRIERVLAKDIFINTIEEIDFSNNNLTQLPPSLLKLKNLKALNLNNNGLITIDIDDFLLLNKLEILNISNNPLENIPSIKSKFEKLLPNMIINFD